MTLKRNGKGKEYYEDGKLRFEGEYLNDKEWIGNRYDDNGNILYKLNNNINGDGKEYYENGKLKFEGEYKYDKKWIGKGYDLFGNIIYELKDGKGLIKEYLSNEIKI